MSTTLDKQVALDYAASQGGAGIVFELAMGMVDRGADLSWLSQAPRLPPRLYHPLPDPPPPPTFLTSLHPCVHALQYPHEREILFPPLTGIEVRSTRVDGAVLVVEMGINVNVSLTVEEVRDALELTSSRARDAPRPHRAAAPRPRRNHDPSALAGGGQDATLAPAAARPRH